MRGTLLLDDLGSTQGTTVRGTWKIVGRMTVQVRLRRRLGFERLPVVTGVTFAVTATTSGLARACWLGARRDPACPSPLAASWPWPPRSSQLRRHLEELLPVRPFDF